MQSEVFIMYDVINSRYTYKGTDVIKNKLGIKDKEKLNNYEKKMVAFKLATIQKIKIKEQFNEKRLKFIHYYLFCDIYDFAGIYRIENIIKENFRFSEYEYIEENLRKTFKDLNVEELKKLSFEEFIKKISYYMTELNIIHPFREGNGRTIREFIRQIMLECGYQINFSNINYDEILEASRRAVLDDSYQIEIIRKSAIKIN